MLSKKEKYKMQLLWPIVFIATIMLTNVSEAAVDCGSKIVHTVVVDKSAGDFNTVQAAVDSVPANNNMWIKISVHDGTYVEKVTIPKNKPCIFLQGRGRRITKITFDGHEATDTSATFTSFPDNFVAKDITFENSYNLGKEHGGKLVTQALSARIYGDKSAFYDCGFVGLQDTLWDVRGRHFFSKCYIEGAIDFIFGGGQSFFEDCKLNATVGSLPKEKTYGVITAQGRETEDDSGAFVFQRGSVTSTGPTYLGRGYRPFSRVIFYQTDFRCSVVPQGWDPMTARGNEGTLTYAEVDCTGPGSNTEKRVPWLKEMSASDLQEFLRPNFIDQDGWISRQPGH